MVILWLKDNKSKDECLLNDGVVKGCMRYDFLKKLKVVPTAIPLADSLDAMPLQDDHINAHSKDATSTLPLLFDAVIEWED